MSLSSLSLEPFDACRRRAAALIVAICTLVIVSIAMPGRTARAQNNVTVNPIDLVNGCVNFEVETPIIPLLSFHAGLNFVFWEGVWAADDGDDRVFAVGPEMGVRFFPFLGAPTGLWIGPYAGLAYLELDDGVQQETRAAVYTGAMVGFTAVVWDTLVLSGGAGLGYHDLNEVINDHQVGPNEVSPRFRLAVGFAF